MSSTGICISTTASKQVFVKKQHPCLLFMQDDEVAAAQCQEAIRGLTFPLIVKHYSGWVDGWVGCWVVLLYTSPNSKVGSCGCAGAPPPNRKVGGVVGLLHLLPT
jgi:hypothetical protein